jgi:hypothetical protein
MSVLDKGIIAPVTVESMVYAYQAAILATEEAYQELENADKLLTAAGPDLKPDNRAKAGRKNRSEAWTQ